MSEYDLVAAGDENHGSYQSGKHEGQLHLVKSATPGRATTEPRGWVHTVHSWALEGVPISVLQGLDAPH